MFFEKHVFCCINKRPDSNPKGCCSSKDSEKLQIELKTKIKDLKLNKKIRINKSGCLDRCELGPIRPSEKEVKHNPRSRSGIMRVAERTAY